MTREGDNIQTKTWWPEGVQMYLRPAIFVALVMFVPSLSLAADWYVSKDGPDVFGKTTILAGADYRDGRNALVVQCDTEMGAVAAILAKSDDPLDKEISGANFILVASPSPRVEASASIIGWNDKYDAIAVRDQYAVDEIISVLEAATGTIQFGAEVNGFRLSGHVGSSGSTTAMQVLREECVDKLIPN